MSAVTDKRYALVLSGGGVRATAFHLGVILRLAVDWPAGTSPDPIYRFRWEPRRWPRVFACRSGVAIVG
jgi:hypothetical protein